jgi:hypothetical protein
MKNVVFLLFVGRFSAPQAKDLLEDFAKLFAKEAVTPKVEREVHHDQKLAENEAVAEQTIRFTLVVELDVNGAVQRLQNMYHQVRELEIKNTKY